MNPESYIDKAEMLDDMKERINRLLWVILPKETSLGRAEEVAVTIFDLVQREWEGRGAP